MRAQSHLPMRSERLRPLRCMLRCNGRFHFGFQPSVTQRHLPSPTVTRKSANRFYWVLFGDAGCKMWRTENPQIMKHLHAVRINSLKDLRSEPTVNCRQMFPRQFPFCAGG